MTIQSIAQLAHRQLFPAGVRATTKLPEFIETAKADYAYRIWERNRLEWAELGENNIPSYLLTEVDLTVENNEADISELTPMRSLQGNTWIQSVGDRFDCEGCRYLVVDFNKYKLLCNDESVNENTKFAIPLGKKIKFPNGTFDNKKTVPFIYANNGEGIDETMEIDDGLGSLVRQSLIALYGGKIGATDETNNSNATT